MALQGQAWKWPGVTLWLHCPPGGWECSHSGPRKRAGVVTVPGTPSSSSSEGHRQLGLCGLQTLLLVRTAKRALNFCVHTCPMSLPVLHFIPASSWVKPFET